VSVNQQYLDRDPFGGPGGYASTGAPGTPGVTAAESAPVLASGVIVSVAGQSSQVAPDLATVSVGDTIGMASDSVVPRGTGDPLSGLSWSDVSETGSGMGRTRNAHPNSPWRQAGRP
jgi:hypothetical protein